MLSSMVVALGARANSGATQEGKRAASAEETRYPGGKPLGIVELVTWLWWLGNELRVPLDTIWKLR
jgi:hypothetical protein